MSATYDTLALVIGHSAADRLVTALGGGTLRIPRSARTRSGQPAPGAARLDEVIGEAARDALIAHYGGETLYIPQNASASVRERERRALELAALGLPVGEIAARLRYTTTPTCRWVAGVIARHRSRTVDHGTPDA